MNRMLLKALTAAAFVFVLLAFFPFLALYDACVPYLLFSGVVEGVSLSTLLLRYAVCVLAGVCGYVLGWFFDAKLKWLPFPRKMGSLPFLLLLAAGSFLLWFFRATLYDAIGIAVMTIVYFCAGQASYFFTYNEVLTWKRYYIVLAFYVGVLLFLQVFAVNPFGVLIFAVFFLLMTLLLLFGLNQSNIDFMMQRRKHRLDALPQKIRSYNLALLGGVSAVVVALFLLYKPIGSFLGMTGGYLFSALKALMRLLTRDADHSTTDQSGTTDIGQDDTPNFGDGGNDGTHWFWSVFGVLIILVGLFLIWYYRKEIRGVFRELGRKISSFIRHLLYDGRSRTKEDTTDFYSEVDENVMPEEEIADLKEEAKQLSWREWKHDYRRFGSMAESPEKFRYGYQLIIRWLRVQGAEIACSATTLEICRISQEKSRCYPDLSENTLQYNELCYGERAFRISTMEGMKAALRDMSQLKATAK